MTAVSLLVAATSAHATSSERLLYVSLQAAMSFVFCAVGIGEALITSTHTSLAAVRAPARLPAAALLQIPSTLLLVLAASVGSRAMISLQTAT